MKIRNGFISNSSSSSFVVGFPKGLSKKEKINLILKKMGIDENSFFYQVAKEVAECIIYSNKLKSKKELADEYGYNSFQQMKEEESFLTDPIEKCEEKGLEIYYGSAANNPEGIGETLFCNMEWNVNDDDFFVSKESGF